MIELERREIMLAKGNVRDGHKSLVDDGVCF